MSERASIFDDADFDVSGFAPKGEGREGGAPSEAVRAVSETAKFRSREPSPRAPSPESPPPIKREPRRYRTGRNVQLNIKVRPETLESFYALADKQGWVLGETLERALAALRNELETDNAVS